eukprot:6190085-Pleurochrysis_carterae.AAC.1
MSGFVAGRVRQSTTYLADKNLCTLCVVPRWRLLAARAGKDLRHLEIAWPAYRATTGTFAFLRECQLILQ